MLEARVLLVHAGDAGDASFMGDLAGACAGEAVTTGVERGAGNEDVGLRLVDDLGDECLGFVLVLAEEVVAADDEADRFDIASLGHDARRRTDELGLEGRLVISLVLAADAAEELVQIEKYCLSHGQPPPSTASRKRCGSRFRTWRQ